MEQEHVEQNLIFSHQKLIGLLCFFYCCDLMRVSEKGNSVILIQLRGHLIKK